MSDDGADAARFQAGLAEMERVQAFDRDGVHASNWAAIRSAEATYELDDVCGWPDCGRSDLVRSHTITKSSWLKPLAHEGHVLMPDIRQRPVRMVSSGLNRATTFPGYCAQHEQRFQQFEQFGEIRTTSDVALQLFRSAAREYWNKRKWIAYFDTLHKQYSEVLMSRALPATVHTPGLVDAVLSPIEDIMRRARGEAEFLAVLWRLLWEISQRNNEADSGATASVLGRLHISTSRRIALSGSSFLDVLEEGTGAILRLPVVVTMLPTGSGVDCLFAGPRAITGQYKTMLAAEVGDSGGDAVVDGWLAAADWWCADPEWWNATDAAWRDSLLKQLGTL